MNKLQLIKQIEYFAPLELQESWDSSGTIIETLNEDINKVLIALTVTEDVYMQAKKQNCDMIISHHPLFFVPFKFKDIDIYCAHTNMDRAQGGTTDTLVKALGFDVSGQDDFLRFVDTDILIKDLNKKIKLVSPNAKLINNNNIIKVKKIGFCAGSGMEFYELAVNSGCDCFVTGDIKYHPAIDCEIAVYDIGHFESEVLIKKVFYEIIKNNKVEVVYANEKTPFENI